MRSFSRNDMRPYQNHMTDFAIDNEFSAIWAEMGLGKTVSTLTAISDLLLFGESKKVLVVGPLLVVNNTWPDEIEVWDHLRHLDFSICTGTELERYQGISSPAKIHFINRENVVWLWKFWKDAWPYDTVVIDEASSFKNPKRKTPASKSHPKGDITRFTAMAKARNKISRMIQLAGTPAPNGYLDLWSQIYLLDQGKRFGKSFYKFREEWFRPDRSGYKWTPFRHTGSFIEQEIQGLCVSLKAEDYISLPKQIKNIVKVKLPAGILKKYRAMERTYSLSIGDVDICAPNAGSLTGKLLQLANGAIYDEDRNVHWAHDVKLDALESIIEEAAGEPVLVAYSFIHDLPRIKARFPQAVDIGEVKGVVKKWNNKEIPILLVHPASAGHGLNLQFGGAIAVWFGLSWSLEFYLQFNKRLHRPGQQKPVFLHHIVAEGTVDEAIMEVLKQREITQDKVTSAVKAYIKQTCFKIAA